MGAAKTAASRRYIARMAVAMAIYLVTLFLGETLIEGGAVDGLLLWGLAVLPGLAIIGAIYALGLYIVEESDEFLRMLVVRQALIATGIALGFASIWGFLENYGLVAHVDAYWIVVIWFFGNGLGALVTRITHGSWGVCW